MTVMFEQGGSVLVANHLRFAPADRILDVLSDLGQGTADAIAERLDLSTRDVVATLNALRRNGTVGRAVYGEPEGDRTFGARWGLLAAWSRIAA